MSADWIIRDNKTDHDPTNYKISTLLGRRKVAEGDIGLEIEVEGTVFPKTNEWYDDNDDFHQESDERIPKQWKYVEDGSLRGQDNAEYVLVNPIKFDEVPGALKDLWAMFEECGSVLDESNRTSVHVHLNVNEFHLNRLCSFIALYTAVEEVLTAWCGDHRVGNLFCLRAKDAPAILSKARSFLTTGLISYLDDGLHYSGLNLHAITKHGSIEIRTMRGVKDPEVIQTWVDILRRIYDMSDAYEDPRAVCEMFSGGGSERFLRYVLGNNTDRVVQECGMSADEINNSVRQGIRMAQRLCYCRDWSSFKPSKTVADPFGRKMAVFNYVSGLTEAIPISFNSLISEEMSTMEMESDYSV